jgi:hypothetical protein
MKYAIKYLTILYKVTIKPYITYERFIRLSLLKWIKSIEKQTKNEDEKVTVNVAGLILFTIVHGSLAMSPLFFTIFYILFKLFS